MLAYECAVLALVISIPHHIGACELAAAALGVSATVLFAANVRVAVGRGRAEARHAA